MKVAVLGGTGKFGHALATRLVEAGEEVILGSRDGERAREAAAELGARGEKNEVAASAAELVVLAVPAEVAVTTARELRAVLAVPLLSVAAEIEFAEGIARPSGRSDSIAERVSETVDVPVVAGLHTLAARRLAASRPEEDAFVCGDDPEAKALVLDLAERIVSGRALDAGPLATARALEAMTAVLLNLNRGYKTHTGLSVTGLP
ncbi:MAG TPA: NAD(P)-binding domain-containing protein [Gaiellaceae bacterium]|nr:NAD(P)-binding domain-containing protein [Gaiellaceae bacterium]